jgi:hypothetical protein
MTPSMNKKRRQMIEGTQVLWSTMIYVPSMVFAITLLNLIGPIVEPFQETSKPAPFGLVVALGIFFVIGAPLLLRSQVWRPLRALAENCGSRELFWSHCKRITMLALPYAPLVGIPAVCFCLSLGSWFMLVQIALILGAEHFIEKWRERPIRESVDAVLDQL